MNSANRSRACEGCKIRKVKCDGGQPCLQCAHLEVSCIVRPPTKRRNPIRGRLVAKLRGEESGFHGAKDASVSPNPTLPWLTCGPASHIGYGHGNRLLQETLLVSPLGMASGYTARFFTDLLPQFERIVYPVNPVISPGEIGEAIVDMGSSFEDFALVHSFGAITIFLTQTTSSLSPDVSAQMNELMQLSLEAHKRGDIAFGRNGYLTGEVPVSMKRIMTCIYLEVAMMSFQRLDRSFYLLREAIGMLQVFKATQFSPGSPEAARFERAYWEAFIHERFLTITAGYPSILLPLEFGILEHDPIIQPHVERGFSCLISLFSIVDRPFLAYWTKQEGNGETIPELTAEWIETKQAQLDDHEAIATQVDHELQTHSHGALTELQHADIFITRLWLRTILWQLALSNGLLHRGPKHDTHDGLSLHFPAQRLSIQLHNLVTRLESLASISKHGSGITQKLFEITSTIADVLAVPLGYDQSDNETDTQVKKFVFLAEVLIDFQRIRDYQKQYLRGKLDTVRRKYPALPDYIPPAIAIEVEGTVMLMK